MSESIGSPLLWILFTTFILGMLALDLGVFHRRAHVVRFREALTWTGIWIGLALTFNVWIVLAHGTKSGMEFLTGYVIEKALSVDNVFVFLVIFTTFRLPAEFQHRVLFWGVLGALIMRATFIVLGGAALEAFHGVLYIFGGILLVTGMKLLLQRNREEHPERNPIFRLFQRIVPTTSTYQGQRFIGRVDGRRVVTPLFAVLLLIEITDLVFAVDSIPAVFAVTRDPFIVFTSNIFAVLGLRALYFCVSGFVARLRYLKVGLALVLIFVAIKILISDVYEIPIGLSLLMVLALLGGATLASLARPAQTSPDDGGDPGPRADEKVAIRGG